MCLFNSILSWRTRFLHMKIAVSLCVFHSFLRWMVLHHTFLLALLVKQGIWKPFCIWISTVKVGRELGWCYSRGTGVGRRAYTHVEEQRGGWLVRQGWNSMQRAVWTQKKKWSKALLAHLEKSLSLQNKVKKGSNMENRPFLLKKQQTLSFYSCFRGHHWATRESEQGQKTYRCYWWCYFISSVQEGGAGMRGQNQS